jgi:F-type H+-transporting ATPase subunit b
VSEAQAAINAEILTVAMIESPLAVENYARLEKQLQDSEAQIAQARVAAMGALRQVATDTAATIVTRLTGAAPDDTRLNGAVASALAVRSIS